MIKPQNAFTLIEMLVVIFIITIILTITMNFSGDRIQELNNKNTQEEFITAFNDPYLLVSNSNYIDGVRYNSLEISLKKDDNKISYVYNLSNGEKKQGTNNVYEKIKITSLKLNGTTPNQLKISFIPYQLGCTLNDDQGTAYIKIAVNNKRKDYCFKISSQLGRLISIKCKEMDGNGGGTSVFQAVPVTPDEK